MIDQVEAPLTGSRGKGIQPRMLKIVEALDVTGRLDAQGVASLG
jgi:hypothetical protein